MTDHPAPPFVMKLKGEPEDIVVAGERLRRAYAAEVVIITRGRKARLTAHIAQEKARDAMREFMNLP
jgi:hypothetical protein